MLTPRDKRAYHRALAYLLQAWSANLTGNIINTVDQARVRD